MIQVKFYGCVTCGHVEVKPTNAGTSVFLCPTCKTLQHLITPSVLPGIFNMTPMFDDRPTPGTVKKNGSTKKRR